MAHVSGSLDMVASSPVPRNVEQIDCRMPSMTMLRAVVAAYLPSDLVSAVFAPFPGAIIIGRGEPGGLVVDLDRGL